MVITEKGLIDYFFKDFTGRQWYQVGQANCNYTSTDTNEVPRFVENPEWKIKNLEEQIELSDKRSEYYNDQIDKIISLKGKEEENKKELKKELEKLHNSE